MIVLNKYIMLTLASNSILCTFEPFALQNEPSPVVRKVDNAIHWINDLYQVDSAIFFVMLIRRWIVIYPVNSVIQRLNNWDLECKKAM